MDSFFSSWFNSSPPTSPNGPVAQPGEERRSSKRPAADRNSASWFSLSESLGVEANGLEANGHDGDRGEDDDEEIGSSEPCPDIGDGWFKVSKQRTSGKTSGRVDHTWVSPDGVQFRSRAQAIKHVEGGGRKRGKKAARTKSATSASAADDDWDALEEAAREEEAGEAEAEEAAAAAAAAAEAAEEGGRGRRKGKAKANGTATAAASAGKRRARDEPEVKEEEEAPRRGGRRGSSSGGGSSSAAAASSSSSAPKKASPSQQPTPKKAKPSGHVDAASPPRPAHESGGGDAAALNQLKEELAIKEPIGYIAAARDMLLSPQVGFKSLCEAHGMPYSRGAYSALINLVRVLALHQPPACALNLEEPKDKALVGNLQMLLQTSTANGGSSSRSVLYLNTIAVAIEMARCDTLNFTASCIRHGVKMAEYGKDGGVVHERVTACRDRILELGLLDRDHSQAIQRKHVDAVRARMNVSIADAADGAAAFPDDVDAACEHVRKQLKMPTAEELAAAVPEDDTPLLKRLQPLLKQKNVAPSLKTIAVAVALHRDPDVDVDACCAAHGIPQAGKVALERVSAVRDRIEALGLLKEGGIDQAEAAAQKAASEEASSSGAAFGASSAASAGPSAVARPGEDEAWLKLCQERIGPRKPAVHGGKVSVPTVPTVAAAVEVCRTNQYDVDFADLQERHGIKVTWSHMWDVADRIKRLGLLEVAPSALSTVPTVHDPAVLRSLQLRLHWHPAPNLENLAVALDLHLDASGATDLVTAGVWRRLEVGRLGGLHRQKAIERLREGLRRLTSDASAPPLDAPVDESAVDQVRDAVKRSGLAIPKVALAANAVAKHRSDILKAVNEIRTAEGHEPVPPSFFSDLVEQSAAAEAEAAAIENAPPRPRPPPISDELLAELQRRVSVRLKRHLHLLPAPKYFLAAADLCTPDIRDVHWRQLRDVDLRNVCKWHGIQLQGPGRKDHLDRLRELRNHLRDFSAGPLEALVPTDKKETTKADATLYANLQLLLQTSTAAGGSASRPALALSTIAVAITLLRDPAVDVDATCVLHGICPAGKQTAERVGAVRDRIVELGLLDRDLTRPIDRRLVDAVRARMNVSIADAAEAVATHGRNLRAACRMVSEQMGLRGGEEEEELVEKAEGLDLHLSERSSTGYLGVRKNASGKFYEVWSRPLVAASYGSRNAENRRVRLGTYSSAVGAAVAYAKHRASLPADYEELEEEEEEGKGEEGEGEEEDDEEEGEEDDADLMPREILRDNGKPDKVGKFGKRWLVRWEGKGDEVEAWLPRERLPMQLLHEYETAEQTAFNKRIDAAGLKILVRGSAHPSGVVSCSVVPADALKCAEYLKTNWVGGQLELACGKKCFGWATYGKTISPHDAEQQRLTTMLLTHDLIPAVREHVPGFAAMEATLTAWLNERSPVPVELFYAHGLRQSQKTLTSTGFAVHQDTEDFDFIEYSIVVKLTADVSGEPRSQMRVVGGTEYFDYDAPAGSSGLFQARMYHASVAPRSKREHIKIAFFFRNKQQK